ncbi:hypothetical protein SAMN02745728_02014 [Desulfovibrio litoralis DSM 11393]|uniref:Uncharacterized protein n=1 Tax=Desulfovibrio litoralis DSM 11393 TaxID=1121455 RepID=A0A1M7THM2_9BACT|nr:hypothetical protein SAMN02745728_02014 [Desulfovibrio litoralis DSM 11393]
MSAGTYDLWAPDYPHSSSYTTFYRKNPKGHFDLVWFRINESRYLHIGHVSDGCVTVMDIEEWECQHPIFSTGYKERVL